MLREKHLYQENCLSAFALPSPSLLCQTPNPYVFSYTIVKSATKVPTPGKILFRCYSRWENKAFILSETSQLAPNKLKYFFSSSRLYGWRREKWRRDLDFAHLGPAMIFNYPKEGVFYWATQLHTVTCPV